MNLRRFKIHRSYSMSFNLSDVGEFFWSWILRAVTDFEKKKRKANRSFVFTCSQSVKLGIFMLWFFRGRQRNVPKSVLQVQRFVLLILTYCCYVVLTAVVVIFVEQQGWFSFLAKTWKKITMTCPLGQFWLLQTQLRCEIFEKLILCLLRP